MTNKSGLTFFLSIKYLSVCLSEKYNTITFRKIKEVEKSMSVLPMNGFSSLERQTLALEQQLYSSGAVLKCGRSSST